MNEPGRRHGGGGKRRSHGAGVAGPRAGSESNAASSQAPPLPRPNLWWPPAPRASGAGKGAPLLEASAAVGRRQQGGRVGQPGPARCGLCVAFPPPEPGCSRLAVRPLGGSGRTRRPRGRCASERPARVSVSVLPSRVSPERKLEAVSCKRVFVAELVFRVLQEGTWTRKTGSQELLAPASASAAAAAQSCLGGLERSKEPGGLCLRGPSCKHGGGSPGP